MTNLINRRRFTQLLGGATAASALPNSAGAQSGRRLVIGNWGGDSQKVLDNFIVSPYLKPKGIDVSFDAAAEAPRKVKILAERALPRGTMDIAGLTDSGAYELFKNNALEEIDYSRISAASQIIPELRKPYMLPQFFSTRVILYNPERINPAPTSYADLWNPAYAGKVGVIDIQYQSTIESAALVGGGSISNYEPGKQKLLELKKMGVRVYPTNEAMAQALQSGECSICIMWQARGVMWQNAGIPIKIAFPKEGLALYQAGFSIPKNARNKNEAYEFLNAALQTDTQTGFANAFGYNPPLKDFPLPADYRARIGIPEGMDKQILLADNDYLLKNDALLKDWWDKVFKA
ncbi:extracellular solute-binding protein [Bosea vestrisii]|uniref:ABC transporter substrate-binding protein n=1 Tax=Bosea vestrisii TaxID=151416 RepID=UPI0024DF4BB5|nr:extracellular solute-binding protein [Bosea vestrisii]WID95212.1 extracellular solute-binding protein [Bosea vestrisii]